MVSPSAPAPPFFNRERELDQLEAVWAAHGAQLATLWGRRRVGKSTLLTRFASGKRSIYLYGTRMAERDILAGLANQVAETFDDHYLRSAPFPTWESALNYLAAKAEAGRLLLIFDEFPYLCEVTAGLDTLVQRWWDRFHQSADLMLVLAGSGFSFMAGLTGARGALHGRRTAQIEVHPFDYFDATSFFPHLTAGDRVRAYACFGGIPAYLRHWDQTSDLAETIRKTLLTPGHHLFREGEELLRTEFHQEALYASILRAVASGEHRPSDIARAVGRHSADEIFDHLRRLLDLHFLRREVPITEWQRPRTQRVLYRLADPYLRFWFRYVSPFQSFLQLGKAVEVWGRDIQPTLDEFVASTTWEEACIQHLWRRLAAGALPTRFAQIGRWWDGSHEVDIVGLWQGQVTVAGECKWTTEPMREGVFAALQQKVQVLPLNGSPLWVLASRSGFDPVLHRRAEHGDLLLLEPASLFRDT
ncbi:MAG: ATP-binding protein [Chloroflexi bacterium]|nr:ATP-binding protein [Chloroflexota bacterium]